MAPLEIMAGVLMGYLIIANLSDVMNMVILSGMIVLGLAIGVVVFYAARSVLLSPNAPYVVAVILFASFATWKFGVPARDPAPSLDRRRAIASRNDGLQQA
jgi:Flp pilus assembly protein protease CpaA